MLKTKKTKRAFWVLVAIIVSGLAVVAGCELAVNSASKGRVYSDVDEIPHREVGLLLGTNPKGRRGGANMGGGGSNNELTNWDGTKRNTGWGRNR